MYKSSKDILEKYKDIKANIKNYELDLEEFDLETLGTRGMSYDNERTSPTNKVSSEIENLAIKREDKIAEIMKKKRWCEITLERLHNAISTLNELPRKVIELRYIGTKTYTYEEIGEEIDRTPVRCKQIVTESIIKIDKAMGLNEVIPKLY